MASKQLRIVIYLRVSTDDQVDGTGLEVQEAACRRAAENLGAIVIVVEIDPGISGTVYPRPALERALTLLETGMADALLAYNVSRLGRKASICMAICERIQAAQGRLFLSDSGEVTEDNELLFSVQSGFAQHEWREICKRMKSGFRRRAEQGIQPCRNLSPMGYHIVTKADVLRADYPPEALGTYQIVEEEAVWVREVFKRYAAGDSLREVIRFLHTKGAPTKQGKNVWYRCSVQAILMNAVYVGRPTFGRRQSRSDKSRLKRGLKSASYTVPSPPEKIVTLSPPALVSEEVWDICQKKRAENKEKLSGNPERRYLLSGLLKCPVCGRGMTGKGGLDKERRYYLCRQANSSAEPGLTERCTIKHYAIDKTEHIILQAVLALAREPERIEAAIAIYNSQETLGESWDSAGKVHTELLALNQREQATARAQVEAMIQGRSAEVYDRLLAEIGEKRTVLQAKFDTLWAQEKRKVVLEPKTVAEKYAKTVKAVEVALTDEEVKTAEKHAILATIIKSITPEGEGFRIQTVYYASP